MHSAATQLSNNFSVELIAGLETVPTASVSERNLQLEHFCKLSKYDERLFERPGAEFQVMSVSKRPLRASPNWLNADGPDVTQNMH